MSKMSRLADRPLRWHQLQRTTAAVPQATNVAHRQPSGSIIDGDAGINTSHTLTNPPRHLKDILGHLQDIPRCPN